jgi:hypothetical protein
LVARETEFSSEQFPIRNDENAGCTKKLTQKKLTMTSRTELRHIIDGEKGLPTYQPSQAIEIAAQSTFSPARCRILYQHAVG